MHRMTLVASIVAALASAGCHSATPDECTPRCAATEYCCLGSCRPLGSVCGTDPAADASVPLDLSIVDPCAPKNGALTASACRDSVTMIACLKTAIGNTFDCSAFGGVCYEQLAMSVDGPYTRSGCAPAGRETCDRPTTNETDCRGDEVWLCEPELGVSLPMKPPLGLFPSSVPTWHLKSKCKVELARPDATCTVVDYPNDVPARSAAMCTAP